MSNPHASARSRSHTLRRGALVLGMPLLAAAAWGAWPSQPDSPLVLGGLHAFDSHALTTTPDGATWVAWVDMECFGSLRVQRADAEGSLLVPGGLALDPVTGCVGRAARMAACADGSVVVSGVVGSVNGAGPLEDTPVQRIAPDGASLWGDGIIVAENATGKIGGFLGLPDGDALIAWHTGMTVFVGRFAADGSPVWRQPASIPVLHGSTMRIFGVLTDGAGGAFVIWDTPGTYTRAIFAARVTAEGAAAWAAPVHLTAVTPSSMHTDPVAIADGDGAVVVVWTKGLEQAQFPVPLLIQRMTADGSLAFAPEGLPISLDVTRQFEPVISRDAVSGDVFIAWRDGIAQQTLRAQRLTLIGDRLWGNHGVGVTSIAPSTRFDAIWNENVLAMVVANQQAPAGEARVQVHRADAQGIVASDPWPISGPEPAGVVHCAALADGALVAAWFQDIPSFPDQIVANRVNADGTIGLPSVTGDATGDGQVNVDDLVAVILGWGACPARPEACPADVNQSDAVDVDDLIMVILNWG